MAAVPVVETAATQALVDWVGRVETAAQVGLAALVEVGRMGWAADGAMGALVGAVAAVLVEWVAAWAAATEDRLLPSGC